MVDNLLQRYGVFFTPASRVNGCTLIKMLIENALTDRSGHKLTARSLKIHAK